MRPTSVIVTACVALETPVGAQVEGEPRRAVCVGVSADEFPGVRPVISGNASAKGPMGLLTVFVADTDNRALTTPNN